MDRPPQHLASAPDVIGMGSAVDRARYAVHRFGLPVIALFVLTLFGVSVRDGFPDKVEAFGTPVLALVIALTSLHAWRRQRVSVRLERLTLAVTLGILAIAPIESAITERFEIGYPYILGFMPLGYAASFLMLGPAKGAAAAAATYLGGAIAAMIALSTGELHLARTLPITAGGPILIGLLYALTWSMTAAARAQVAAQTAAATDPLTGALNRRSAEAALARLEGPYSILVVDLDDFKQINDAFGHGAGDNVLVNAVRGIRDAIRPDDLLVRWGGDEFVVVAPGTGAQTAPALAERIASAIASVPTERGVGIAASIGFAERQGSEVWREVLDRADRDMYVRKSRR